VTEWVITRLLLLKGVAEVVALQITHR